jgi:hypothetical protein
MPHRRRMPTEYCRHIRANGTRCRSLALATDTRCHWHRDLRARHGAIDPPPDGTVNIIHPLNFDPGKLQREPLLAEYYSQTRGPLELRFPALEDRQSVQLAISMLISALGLNRIEPKRAMAMLYGLQVASSNASHLPMSEGSVVTDTVRDESGDELAPDEDPQEVIENRQILEELARMQSDEEDEEDEDEVDEETLLVTSLNASAESASTPQRLPEQPRSAVRSRTRLPTSRRPRSQGSCRPR